MENTLNQFKWILWRYFHMIDISTCGGGGWTLVLRMNGKMYVLRIGNKSISLYQLLWWCHFRNQSPVLRVVLMILMIAKVDRYLLLLCLLSKHLKVAILLYSKRSSLLQPNAWYYVGDTCVANLQNSCRKTRYRGGKSFPISCKQKSGNYFIFTTYISVSVRLFTFLFEKRQMLRTITCQVSL